MSIDDTPGGADRTDAPSAPAEAFEDAWEAGLADPWADPGAADLFSAELANVDASDWDVDADLIWGDDPAAADHVDDAGGAFDMPL